MQEVAAVSTPAHIFTAAGDTTPSSGRYNGMIGPTMPKEMLMMNCTATMLHRVTRQRGGSSAAGAVESFIGPTIRACGEHVKARHGFASRAAPRYGLAGGS